MKTKKSEIKVPALEFKTEFEPGTLDKLNSDGEIKSRELLMFPLDRISTVSEFNIRIMDAKYEAKIESIKRSIMERGFLRNHPLKGYIGREGETEILYLTGGYTRYEAAKRAVAEGMQLPRVPVVVTPKGTSMTDLIVGLKVDNDGANLQPYELGILIKRLQALDMSLPDIVKNLDISKQYVDDLLVLMEAPKAIHNMVTSGEVSAAFAVDLIREKGSGKEAVEALRAGGATGESPTEKKGKATKTSVSKAGGTSKPNKRILELLLEYLLVLNSQGGAESAIDFLTRWQAREKDAVAELSKVSKPKKKSKKKTKKAGKKKAGKKKDPEADEPL